MRGWGVWIVLREGGRDGVGRLEGLDAEDSGYLLVGIARRGLREEDEQVEECILLRCL